MNQRNSKQKQRARIYAQLTIPEPLASQLHSQTRLSASQPTMLSFLFLHTPHPTVTHAELRVSQPSQADLPVTQPARHSCLFPGQARPPFNQLDQRDPLPSSPASRAATQTITLPWARQPASHGGLQPPRPRILSTSQTCFPARRPFSPDCN